VPLFVEEVAKTLIDLGIPVPERGLVGTSGSQKIRIPP
jgi:hypothetical protein